MSETTEKLKPGAIELTAVAKSAFKVSGARVRLDRALTARREAFAAAAGAGATQQEIAEASGLTVVRVGQILGGVK